MRTCAWKCWRFAESRISFFEFELSLFFFQLSSARASTTSAWHNGKVSRMQASH